MAAYTFPTSAELIQVAQDYVRPLMAERPIFKIFPTRNVESNMLIWEQMDNFIGLQQVRGLDGQPARVKKVGLKSYQMQPGVYGDQYAISELELTTRRRFGTFGTPVDASDLVMIGMQQLTARELDRIEAICWLLLTTGTFSVAGPTGAILHTDTFNIQTFTAGVTWATSTTATPLADLRAVQLLHRGHSASFDATATAYMNRTTFNNFISNTNNGDLFGRRQTGLQTINNVQDANALITRDDLPQIVIWDQGYYDDNGAFQLFIPNGKVVIVGRRPASQTAAEYRFTINANNPDMAPGPYAKVIDTGEQTVPRQLILHKGHNGGPVMYYPSAFVTMNV